MVVSLTCDSVSGAERYEIIVGDFTWQGAKLDAEARGGHLATVTSVSEWQFLKSRFGNQLLGLFLGASDDAEGAWQWVTGEEWKFTGWNLGQPDNSSGLQDFLWLHPAYGLKWDDTANAGATGYLLEREGPDVDSDGDDLTDQYELGIGRYQIITGIVQWNTAKAAAESRGGHLATITTESEWQFIYSSFSPQLLGKSTAIGGTDAEQEGVWMWITGEAFTFSFWQAGEPNNAGNEDAISITPYAGAPWNDAGVESEFDQFLLEFGYPTDPFNPDTDGDGFLDGEEARAGSSPLDAESKPAARLSIFPAVEIEFDSEAQQQYQIQSSNDLISWTNIGGPIQGDGNKLSRFFQSREKGPYFYRIQRVP